MRKVEILSYALPHVWNLQRLIKAQLGFMPSYDQVVAFAIYAASEKMGLGADAHKEYYENLKTYPKVSKVITVYIEPDVYDLLTNIFERECLPIDITVIVSYVAHNIIYYI